jgi:N-acetyl-anhydromuramyl-L-alanine amidase AmpD
MVDGGGSTSGRRPLIFPIPFIEARNFTPANRTAIDLVVIHSMESPETARTARNVAEWFASEKAPRTSAHYLIDADEVIQSVRDKDVAWAAPGANATGLHLEHAGRADQAESDWRDEFSMATLHRSIELCAVLCKVWGIPALIVLQDGLLTGGRGITTHAEVSKAFRKSDHTDPGPNFPLQWYAERVWSILAEGA